jgi:RNA polymerase sigma-70 factor (ECF subfamily)
VDPSGGTERSDEELLVAARAGEDRAFEALLVRHEARVLRVLRLFGVRPADREDVAQDVFVRVFRHMGGFHSGKRFQAWLYRITVNAAHDHRRRQARRAVEESATGEELDRTAAVPSAPVEVLADRDRLEAALERLTPRERAVFVLREMEGLEGVEVARALGITRITVRRHLGRAREHLRRTLEEGRDESASGVERLRRLGGNTRVRETGEVT